MPSVAISAQRKKKTLTAWQRPGPREKETPAAHRPQAKRENARREPKTEIDLNELPIPVGLCPRCGLTIEAPLSVLMAAGVVRFLCGLRMQAGKAA